MLTPIAWAHRVWALPLLISHEGEMIMPDSLSRTLARYVATLQYDALPLEVVDKIKASLLHALIMALVGAETRYGQAAIALIKAEERTNNGTTPGRR